MLRDSVDMVFKQRSDFGYTKDPSGTTHRISLAIGPPTRCARNDITLLGEWITLQKKETITLGAPARCARHDITLPGHVKML